MDQNIAAVVAAILAALLTGIITVGLGLYTLTRQHRGSVALQEAHLRHQIQLDIFREVAAQLQSVADAISATETSVIETLRQIRAQVEGRGNVTHSWSELSAFHFAA